MDSIYEILEELDEKSNDGHKLYRVKCKFCGFETRMQLRHTKLAKNCKHLANGGSYIRHDYSWENKRIEKIFSGIKKRCYSKTDKSYRWYGEKGIKVFQDWIENPLNFEKWAIENGYRDDLTIDRIDPKEDYNPSNCRWISMIDNSKYKSTTSMTEVNGEKHTGREWAEVLCVGTNVINSMLREHGEKITKRFIALRLKDKTIKWLKAYNLE